MTEKNKKIEQAVDSNPDNQPKDQLHVEAFTLAEQEHQFLTQQAEEQEEEEQFLAQQPEMAQQFIAQQLEKQQFLAHELQRNLFESIHAAHNYGQSEEDLMSKITELNNGGKIGEDILMDACYMTPLGWAACYGYSLVANYLIDNGARTVDHNDIPYLCYAVWKGHPEMAIKFIQNTTDFANVTFYGTKVNLTGKEVLSEIFSEAVRSNEITVIEAAIKRCSNSDLLELVDCDWNGRNAISHAAEMGNVDILILLLNISDSETHFNNADHHNNMTPLMYAAHNDHPLIVKALLQLKADINQISKENKTAIDYAAEKGNTESLLILQNHIAELNREPTGTASRTEVKKINEQDKSL
ncbi:MAG: ankyrin repeat domain-containing protein [Pseudomonadota bacterium]